MGGAAATIYVVDDDDGYREALSRMLVAAGFGVRQFASGGALLLAKIDRLTPGCIVLDVSMPGPSGLELHEALAEMEDSLPVVFITGYGDVPASVRAMKAGAVDFLQKPVEGKVLIEVVRTALARHCEQLQRANTARALRERYATLSQREREVLVLVVAGRLNKQIAGELEMAERTVKLHRAHAMEKLGASTFAELMQIASRLEVAASAR